MVGQAVGGLNYPVHLRELYRQGVKLTPDLRLMSARREGNALKVRLRNMYSRETEERTVDWLVVNLGTEPVDEIFHELQASSSNLGTYDIDAMADGELRIETANAEGAFVLFRVGDAVASRNIHAAIFDALRICKDL